MELFINCFNPHLHLGYVRPIHDLNKHAFWDHLVTYERVGSLIIESRFFLSRCCYERFFVPGNERQYQ